MRFVICKKEEFIYLFIYILCNNSKLPFFFCLIIIFNSVICYLDFHIYKINNAVCLNLTNGKSFKYQKLKKEMEINQCLPICAGK